MQAPTVRFQQADQGVINNYAQQAQRFSDASFFNFETDTETFFYLLPPWAQANQPVRLAREIYEGYLPNKSRWISLRSWAYLHPDFAGADPIEAFLGELSALPTANADEIKKATPKARFYINALVVATRKLPNGPQQAFANASTPQVVNLPKTVWDEICIFTSQPGFEVPYDPCRAILWIVKKTGKGLNTEYKVEFAGSRGPTGEVVASRFDLVAQFGGPQAFQPIIDSLQNLDQRWPLPDLNGTDFIAKREEAKRVLKAKFAGYGAAGLSAIPGVSPFPGGGYAMGGPALPNALPYAQPAPVAPAAPPAPFAPQVPQVPAGGYTPGYPAAPVAPTAAPFMPPSGGVTVQAAAPPVGYPQNPPAPVAPQPPVIQAPQAPGFPGYAPGVGQAPAAPSVQSPIPPGLMVPEVPVPGIPQVPTVRIG